MLFHTWTFLLFLAIVYPVYLGVRNTRFRTPWLFLSSYVFYGWWNPLYLLLIAYATTVDFFVVAAMEKSRHRKCWVAVSVANNLGLLSFFKYGGFVVENVNAALAALGAGYALKAPDVTLPVGISFFVFQSMSYTIDFYRGKVSRERSLIRYATFVSFFPQLVAGPIERARALLPQLADESRISRRDVADGLSLFLTGLFKKLVMADYLALYVDQVYAMPAQHDAPALALATVAFGWQIYFDFSGYTDMARGVARMMGYRLMLNFRNPYLATGISDFWARWHISLSSWFRDYVYIPLGGNRGGLLNTYRNILLTMLLSGLWHGAAWTFIIWGALHAAGHLLTRELERSPFYRDRVPALIKQAGVFLFVTFAWIFFRAESLEKAWTVVSRIFSTTWRSDPQCPIIALGLIAAIWLYQYLFESRAGWMLETAPVRIAGTLIMLLLITFFAASGEQAFIYFQF